MGPNKEGIVIREGQQWKLKMREPANQRLSVCVRRAMCGVSSARKGHLIIIINKQGSPTATPFHPPGDSIRVDSLARCLSGKSRASNIRHEFTALYKLLFNY